MKLLLGHTSPETAYVVNDYPYGYRLRCKIRYWLETKKGHGMRLMAQTTNPKAAGEVWNKPKGSTYDAFKVMYLDENEHVQTCSITPNWPSTWMRFYYRGIYHQLPDDQKKIADAIVAFSKRINPDTAKRIELLSPFIANAISTELGSTGNDSLGQLCHDTAFRDALFIKAQDELKLRLHREDFDDIFNLVVYDLRRQYAVQAD